MFKKYICAATLLGTVASTPVGATVLDTFTFTTSEYGGIDETFSLPATGTPDQSTSNFSFMYIGKDVLNGTTESDVFFYFLNQKTSFGGYDLGGVLPFGGKQVYTGAEYAPTFVPGTYNLVDVFTGASGTLIISSVPESKSWAMLLAGFGVIGYRLRRRHQGTFPAAA